jgi:hypothetical protein
VTRAPIFAQEAWLNSARPGPGPITQGAQHRFRMERTHNAGGLRPFNHQACASWRSLAFC